MNKIVIDAVCCPEHVIRRESANSALEYLLDSSFVDGAKPFPDLIFLDIEMPQVDGWEFLELFEKLKSTVPIFPIIIMLSNFVTRAAVLKTSDFPNLSGIFKKPMSNKNYRTIISEYFIPGESN